MTLATTAATINTTASTTDVKALMAKRELLEKERAALLAQKKKATEEVKMNRDEFIDARAKHLGLIPLPNGDWCHPTHVDCVWIEDIDRIHLNDRLVRMQTDNVSTLYQRIKEMESAHVKFPIWSSMFTCHEKDGSRTTCRFESNNHRVIEVDHCGNMGPDSWCFTHYICAVCKHEKCKCSCCHQAPINTSAKLGTDPVVPVASAKEVID
jgi:hypothetical protein